jgi:hypothetical protein
MKRGSRRDATPTILQVSQFLAGTCQIFRDDKDPHPIDSGFFLPAPSTESA